MVAYSPYEGFRVCFTGDRGRLELSERHGSHLIMGQTDKELAGEQGNIPNRTKAHEIRLQKHFSQMEEIPVPKAEGGHGGADPLIQSQFFGLNPPKDHANRVAGWEQGIASVLLGLSANRSIETGKTVRVNDILPIRKEVMRLSELV